MRKQRRIRRWPKRLAALLGASVLVVVLLVLLAMYTSPGRKAVLTMVSRQVSAAIPGSLSAEELHELNPWAVELRGVRVRDPAGSEVVALDAVRVELDPGELIRGRVVLSSARVTGGRVDLRDVRQERRGLVAAFVDPDEPPSAPSDAKPPYVRVEAIEVDSVAVLLPEAPQVGQLDLRDVHVRASFELDGAPRAEVAAARLRLERKGEALGGIDQLRGVVGRGTEPTRVDLRADLGGVQARVNAAGVLPLDDTFADEPLKWDLRLEGVNAKRLARLLQDEKLKDAFEGDVSLELAGAGTPNDLDVTGHVSTDGGRVQLGLKTQKLERAELSVGAEGLELRKIQKKAPGYRATVAWKAEADFADPERVAVVANLDRTVLDDVELPKARASGVVSGDRVDELAVKVSEGKSIVDVEGKVGFDGSADVKVKADLWAGRVLDGLRPLVAEKLPQADGRIRADLAVKSDAEQRLHVKGTVSGNRAVVGTTRAERVDARVDLKGKPPDLSGSVKTEVKGLDVGGTRVSVAKVAVTGGPNDYHVQAAAELKRGRGSVSARLHRRKGHVEVSAEGSGELAGKPVKVSVARTRIDDSGAMRTDGVSVEVAGQVLEASGSFGDRGSDVVLAARSVDLGRMSRALGLTTPIRGRARIAGRVAGAPERPVIGLRFQVARFAVGDRPPIDLSGEASLDATAGTARGRVSALAPKKNKAGRPLEASVDGSVRFATRGQWLEALQRGEMDVRLHVARLDALLVEKWVGAPLPVRGIVEARSRFQGSLDAPELETEVRSDVRMLGHDEAVRVDARAAYARGQLNGTVTAADSLGRWVDAKAALSLGPEGEHGLAVLGEKLRTALDEGRWSVAVDVAERYLDQLPLPPTVSRADLPRASLRARLRARHEPNEEPVASFRAWLRQSAAVDSLGDCKARGLMLEGHVDLEQGRAAAQLVGRARQHELLRLTASARLPAAQLLRGEAFEPSEVSARLRSDTKLSELPFLCRRFRGTLVATASVDDLLSRQPQVDATVRAKGLSAGSSEAVDVSLDARADGKAAVVTGGIDAKGRRSALSAKIPVRWYDGKVSLSESAPVSATLTLDDLPIAPFLDPRGEISYATGQLDGKLEVRGTLKKVRAEGAVELENVAFTATSVAQPLRKVRGRIELNDRVVLLKGFEASDRDGKLELDGRLDLSNLKRIESKVKVRAHDFPLRQFGQVVATVDLDAEARSIMTPERTKLSVRLADVNTFLEGGDIRVGMDLAAHPDIVADGQSADERPEEREAKGRAPADEPVRPAAKPATRVTELTLDASQSFWVKRGDFAVKLSTVLRSRIEGESVRIRGKVKLDRGYLQLMGKVFDIERGSELRFIDSETPDPALDITATHDNRRTGEAVQVRIGGRGSQPELTFLVAGRETTAGEAFLAIYGGQRSNNSPEEANSQARQFVGGVTAGLLATSARRELGAAAPILMVEPGDQAGRGRLRAGFELDSLVPDVLEDIVTGVYLEGIVANDQASQDANVNGGALLEFYFPKGVFTTGQYGPGATWSVDMGWQVW